MCMSGAPGWGRAVEGEWTSGGREVGKAEREGKKERERESRGLKETLRDKA